MSCLKAVARGIKSILGPISHKLDSKQRIRNGLRRATSWLPYRGSTSSSMKKPLRQEPPGQRRAWQATEGMELQEMGGGGGSSSHTRGYGDRNNNSNSSDGRPRRTHDLSRKMAQFQAQAERAQRDLGEEMQRARGQEQDVLRLKREFEADLEEQRVELAQVRRDNYELRDQLTRAAARATRLPKPSPMHRSENDLVDKWQGFSYDVQNFVMGHFQLDDAGEKRLRDWAKLQGPQLKESTPFYLDFVTRTGYNGDLVEAFVWNALCKLVFGDAREMPVLWAGKHAPWLSKMSAELFQDLDLHRSDKHLPTYHRWRTQTTTILTLAASPPSQTPHRASPSTDGVAKSLERMLSPIHNPHATSLRPALQRIVHAAAELDQLFWGQDAWYFPQWPGAGRHGFALDEETMKVVGGVEDSSVVSFVVQPALCRVGGENDKKYRNYCALEKFRVCV